MILNKINTTLAIGLLLAGLSSAHAGQIYSEDFNNYSAGHFNGVQYQSGLQVAYGGNVSGWTGSGGNVAHVVDLDNGVSQDFAVMIWQDNAIKLNNSISMSNITGVNYLVNFLASAAVYQYGPQATAASDGLLIEVLRSNNSQLTSFVYAPGAWTGNMNFSNGQFQYTGDGTGDITLRIRSNVANSGHFAGAIDNLTINTVPEPGTSAIFLAGLSLMGAVVRRRKQDSAV
jgi:PEP-CTERM motif